MTRKLPILPTIMVLVVVAILVRLGFWQIQRLHERDASVARFVQVENLPGAVAWPRKGDRDAIGAALYRRSSFTCAKVVGRRDTAGRSDRNQPGWAHMATCKLAGGGEAEVGLGWSRQPEGPPWNGGAVTGYVEPAGSYARLIASPPQAGLEALERPDPNDLPNSHLSYAIQWFFFAFAALLIYALALRKMWRSDQN